MGGVIDRHPRGQEAQCQRIEIQAAHPCCSRVLTKAERTWWRTLNGTLNMRENTRERPQIGQKSKLCPFLGTSRWLLPCAYFNTFVPKVHTGRLKQDHCILRFHPTLSFHSQRSWKSRDTRGDFPSECTASSKVPGTWLAGKSESCWLSHNTLFR